MKERVLVAGIVCAAMLAGLLTSCAENAAPPQGAAADKAVDWKTELFGKELVKADGTKTASGALAGKKIGVYFSAHWCPPCRGFTPVLVKTYNELVSAKKEFEVVFVSSDQSAEAMVNYMKEAEMPWTAIPFDSPLRATLAEKYGVRGIPTLIVLDEKGQVVSNNARGEVASQGAAAFDKW